MILDKIVLIVQNFEV